MAPVKKPQTRAERSKTMALDYEQKRLENIRRNREKISSLLLLKKSAELSIPPKPTKKLAKKPAKTPLIPSHRSLRSHSKENSSSAPQNSKNQFSFSNTLKMFTHPDSYKPMVKAVLETEEKPEKLSNREYNLDLRTNLGFKKENVRKVFGERIIVLGFMPISDREIIVSGNKDGFLGFWDVGLESENDFADDVFVFWPHKKHVSGISFHPNSIRKMYSSSHDGDLCLMDIEKQMFNIIYSSDNPIFSLNQSPYNHNLLYLGLKGQVNLFDERENKICNTWKLHEKRINTIDLHPQNSNLILTSSTDGFARIWDLRFLNKYKSENIKEIKHKGVVHSAYFSPTGTSLVSASMDDTVRVLSGSNFDDLSIICHNHNHNMGLSSFRAIWGWSDSYVLVGNIGRGIDVISTSDSAITTIKSENMTNIPCLFAINPYKQGHLACAGGGKLYLWTDI